ncbi:5483_t:CDS:1 [Acaulospora colombiana]|uniref:5483_t:CDS:1 n=1 Tax=Acaulospora colombiana TaxID=27376 RepID=A0ACA9L996_9GLOM|nr:5483_t:CDS:1 [Acaulospora colombiana]
MEAIANVIGLDFEYFPAVSRDDFGILEKYNFDIAPNHKTCYVSHYRVFESIVSNGYSSALVLEDDIDLEINISSIMIDIYRILPADWEMLYLGHCTWEGNGELVGNASDFKLLKSTAPACTHAYAVSLLGAKKLIRELVRPSRPVDLEISNKIESGIITSYSLEPSVIVQWKSKDNPSDVSPGSMQWSYPLKNSTLHFLGYKEI